MIVRHRAICLLAILSVFAVPLAAQQLGTRGATPVLADFRPDAPPPSWGTATDIVAITQAGEIPPPNDTITWSTSVSAATGIGIFQTSTTTTDWWGKVVVPSGAIISKVQVEACDTTTTGELLFGLAKGASPAGAAANITGVGTTGLAATPGCGFFETTVGSPTTTLNGSQIVWVFVDWSGAGAFGGAVRLNSARVFYKLSVSPAPGSATFSDVPTSHPFFRFVEALAASGITGGCGSGQYCPDQPVTRGQMAVFIATALGLHFSP